MDAKLERVTREIHVWATVVWVEVFGPDREELERGIDAVNERDPQWHDHEPGFELKASHQATQEQQWRNRGKDKLEVGQGRRGVMKRNQGVGARYRLTLFGTGR